MTDSYVNQDYINDRYITPIKKGDIPKPIKTHRLKSQTGFFQAVKSGIKTFEIRKNDRGFEVGDYLVLLEYDAQADAFSGEEITKIITYLTDFAQQEGFVVMAIEDPK